MVTIIKKSSSRKLLLNRINRLKPRRSFDAGKYLGKIKFDKDPLLIHTELRDEWD